MSEFDKELDEFFSTRILHYDPETGNANIFRKSDMTPEQWITYGRLHIDDEANKHPNAKIAQELLKSPLYEALKEDNDNGNNNVSDEEE
jgi:hypothetical protein